MSLGTSLYTWLYGKLVGIDEYDNKYYCNSGNFQDISTKRWVIFKGEIEATKIPPHWHAWLHKSIEVPPIDYSHKYDWQKNHQPNLTGTSEAYYPNSPHFSKSKVNSNKKEYETWKP